MILAVDLGNYNIKTSEGIIFSSKFTTEKQIDRDVEDIIEVNGVEYCLGKGQYEFEFDKTKKNYIPLLLGAIVKSTKEREIDLVLGCPLVQIDKKDDFIEDLQGKEFEFYYNSKKIRLFINKVAVIAEGLSSFYTLPKHIRENRTLIVDIGGRTVNAAAFVKGKLEKQVTLPIGMLNFYEKVQTKENSKGNNISVVDVESLIEENRIYDVEDLKVDFIKNIINELKLYINTQNYEVFFTGGGTIVLKDIIAKRIKRANIINNALFSNVNGNKAIADVKWR